MPPTYQRLVLCRRCTGHRVLIHDALKTSTSQRSQRRDRRHSSPPSLAPIFRQSLPPLPFGPFNFKAGNTQLPRWAPAQVTLHIAVNHRYPPGNSRIHRDTSAREPPGGQ